MTSAPTYEDLDMETWRLLDEQLRRLAKPGEVRVETLSRLIREGSIVAVCPQKDK